MSEKAAVIEAARIIGISIRSAPKSAGADDILYKILSDSQKSDLVLELKKIADLLIKENSDQRIKQATELDWHSDTDALDRSDCVIVIGVRGKKPLGFNCGGCGFKGCQEFLAARLAAKPRARPPQTIFMPGPFCMFKLLDLGIAVSSAAKTASTLNVDNRIMYRAGLAAYRLGLLEDCNPVIGLPLSASGKNIFFDRKEKMEAKELWKKIKGDRKDG